MNYKRLITGLVSVAISYSLSSAVAVQGGFHDPYVFGQSASVTGSSTQGSGWMDASQTSKPGYTSFEYDPQAPTWTREQQPTSQPESRKALVIHQDEDPNAASGVVNSDQHAPQLMIEQPQPVVQELMIEQPQPVVQVAPQRPAVLPQIDQSRRPENQYGLRGNKPKLLELSNRAMRDRFFLEGGYGANAEHLPIISRRGMRNHVNKIRRVVKRLNHDSGVLSKELDAFCRANGVSISREDVSRRVQNLSDQWEKQQDRYNAPEAYRRTVSYWSTWSDFLWDTFNPFKLLGLLRTNYRRKDRLDNAMKAIYNDITQIRRKSMYNHVYIGLIVQKMNQTNNPEVVQAMERLSSIRYSLSKELQIKQAHGAMIKDYTDSFEREVIPMLEVALDFYTEVYTFNRALSDFWASVQRSLIPDTITL